jgi:FHS family L-fucose permease-like MFS transporter
MAQKSSAAATTAQTASGPSGLLWVIFLSYFTFGMITNVLGVIIPEVIRQYNLSLFLAGLLPFAFFLAYFLCSIPTGLLMDRFGAKALVLLGVALMGLGSMVVSQAQNYPLILAMIFAVGVGVTVLQTAGNPLIHHLDNPENYHRNLTLTIGFCGIGAFLGPFLLAYIRSGNRPWQTLYVWFAVLCLALLVLMAISRFPSLAARTGDRFRFDQLGVLLKNPLVIAYALGIFFYVGAEVGTASWIVKFFQGVHGVSGEVANTEATSFWSKLVPTLPALVVSLFWLAQGVGRLISGAVLNIFGSRRMLRLYALLALVSVLVANFGSKNVSAVAFVACGFFTSVLFTLIFSGTIHTVSQYPGTVSGLLCTAIVGGAIIPLIAGRAGDYWGMHAAMLVPAAAFAYVLGLSLFGRARYE